MGQQASVAIHSLSIHGQHDLPPLCGIGSDGFSRTFGSCPFAIIPQRESEWNINNCNPLNWNGDLKRQMGLIECVSPWSALAVHGTKMFSFGLVQSSTLSPRPTQAEASARLAYDTGNCVGTHPETVTVSCRVFGLCLPRSLSGRSCNWVFQGQERNCPMAGCVNGGAW